jgi:3-phenylpropionate/trans-cinnamate dioxygenase ferredoxin reductase component
VTNRIVVVGASLAGLRAAESLRHGGHDGPITVVGAEQQFPYDRPPLSKQVLTGKAQPEATSLRFDDGLEVEWLLGRSATGIDTQAQTVQLDGDEELPYDSLVIATGAHPRQLPGIPASDGIHYLRTLDDALALRSDLIRSERTVVVGAGFIGLEVACSAQSMGVAVTVLEALPVPLERAIGAEMGSQIAAWHRSKGLDVQVGVGVDGIEHDGTGRPRGVRLTGGALIPADTVVIGVGVAPVTGWLEGSGIDLADGVMCDERLRVLSGGRPLGNVVAAGDVARWVHPTYGEAVRVEHWTNATEQGEAVAETLLRGDEAEPYAPTPYFWSDQHGLKLQFVGRTTPGDEIQVVEGSLEEDRFLIAYGRSGAVVAALGMRRPAHVMALQREITAGGAFPVTLP